MDSVLHGQGVTSKYMNCHVPEDSLTELQIGSRHATARGSLAREQATLQLPELALGDVAGIRKYLRALKLADDLRSQAAALLWRCRFKPAGAPPRFAGTTGPGTAPPNLEPSGPEHKGEQQQRRE